MFHKTKLITATTIGLALSVSVFSTAAVAHEDVKNPTVKARMMAMEAIGGGMKTLAGMAKGEMAFDAEKANAAMAVIAEKSAMAAPLFEANETDPKSEALPAIWENWDDFVKKMDDLAVASKANMTLADAGSLGAALGQVGGACKACHSDYRKK